MVNSEPLSDCKMHDRKDSKEREILSLLDDDIMEMETELDWGAYPVSTLIIAERLSEFLRQLAIHFSQWDHVSTAALRLFTFEALGMRHTCCKMPEPPEFTPDEIIEIREEDHMMLALLDELVEEFTMELRSSGDSLDQFLGRYWVRRIEEVLDELNAARMTEEERKATEELDITWNTSSYKPESSPIPQLSLAEWIEDLEGRIDEILIESGGTGSP